MFSNGTTFNGGPDHVMSVAGAFNVTGRAQFGGGNPVTNFSQPWTQVYVYSPPTMPIGIKVRHGGGGEAAVKCIELSDSDKGLAVFRGSPIADGNERFSVQGDGKTAIYATNSDAFVVMDANNSNTVNFKVKANGETYSRHIKVMITNFPDYVFEPGYKLMNLKEIEKYYTVHKHLPEIPSAAEVEKNDLDLGEMNKLLLKKVEELTILMVQQDKQLDQFKSEIADLKKSMK